MEKGIRIYVGFGFIEWYYTPLMNSYYIVDNLEVERKEGYKVYSFLGWEEVFFASNFFWE